MLVQRGITGVIAAVLAAVVIALAQGDQTSAPDFRKGALYGKVIDVATGRPVAGATVALRDKSGKVVAWTKTGADGQYAIAADTLKLLQLQPSRRRGLLAGLGHGRGQGVTAPAKV